MNSLSFKTTSVSKLFLEKRWLIIDANKKSLGRLASKIVNIIRGKHKSSFTPNFNCGDHVIVINAEKISLKKNNWKNKKYIRYTGYPGGQRFLNARDQFNKNPSSLLEKAVKGMLPKNKLGKKNYKNLHIYVGSNHKHITNKPLDINLFKHLI